MMCMIIITMHLNQIVITFTNNEKYEIQNIINSFKIESKESKPIDRSTTNKQDLEFKYNIVNFIKSKKNQLTEKSKGIDRLKQFLNEERCIAFQQNNVLPSFGIDEINISLQNLRTKMGEMAKNNQIFETFIGFIQEMKDLKQERIYEFEYKLSKAINLSRMQRETLALIAKKLVKVDSLSKMNDIQDDIVSFFSKIIRYGIYQEFKELERIGSQDIKNKCYKLLEYLQNNCIQTKQEFNPVRSLLKKLSISIYDKNDIINSLADLPPNIKLIFEPVCLQIFRLRQGAAKSTLTGEAGLMYVSHDMKKAQELNLESLKKEREQFRKKCLSAEGELKRTKFILEKLGHMSNLFREENLYESIQSQLGNIGEQLKIYLQRIYEHLKSFEQLTLGARKASFIERKDKQIQFLQEKLSLALQELDVLKSSKVTIEQTQSMLLDQNSQLQSQSSENARLIQQYQNEMNNLNSQINEYSKQIGKLKGQLLESEKNAQFYMKENFELHKQLQHFMKLSKDEEKEHQKNLVTINKSLQIEIKALKQENQSLHQKCIQRATEHNELQEKTKQIASLKCLQAQNIRLMQLISRLNREIQNKQQKIAQIIFSGQIQEDFTQTTQQQQNHNNPDSTLNAEIQKLKEEKAKLELLKSENDQLKQERVFRLNEEKQMKRIYRQQKADISQIQSSLEEYKQKYDKIVKEYDALKKKHNQMRLEEFERRVHNSNKLIEGTDTQKQNLKKMQEKHRILERNFDEVKKYNELIKSEYHKLKQETSYMIRSKVKQVIEEYKQNEIKMKKQIEHLANKNAQYHAKLSIIQQQNLNLKLHLQKGKQLNLSNLKQKDQMLSHSLNFTPQKHRSQSKQKLRAQLRQTKIKNEESHIKMINDIRAKEEEISAQRIQILKLEQKLDQAMSQIEAQSQLYLNKNDQKNRKGL